MHAPSVLLQVLGQEVLDVLLLLGRTSVDGRVSRLAWTPWFRSSDEHNGAQSGQGQHVRLDRSSKDGVSGSHDDEYVFEIRIFGT